MTALFKTRTRAADDPLTAGLAEIDAMWGPGGWFLTQHELVLAQDLDTAYHGEKRRLAQAIAEARAAELRAALLARGPR